MRTDKQEVLDRWKQYFADLMKPDRKIVDKTQEENLKEKETEIEQPTYTEISDTITKLKGNKAPSIDNISAELIKHGGYTLKTKCTN